MDEFDQGDHDEGEEQPLDFLDADDVEVVYLDNEEDLELMDEFEQDEGYAGGNDDDENRIVEEINDISKFVFRKHQGPVFTCALSKDEQVAITGGEDDMAYLWKVDNGEVLLECTGHKDSVTEVEFNFDNSLVATADMSGLLQVWSVNDKKLIWCIETDEIEWMKWHHASNILIVGTNSGDVYIYLVPSGNCKILVSAGYSATCGHLLSDGKRLVVGYSNGTVKLWDLKTTTAEWCYTDIKENSINALRINAENTLILLCPSGQLIKMNDGKLLTTILADGENEIESCEFNHELGVVATGALSGQICVWELGKYALRHQAKIECAVTKMSFGKNGKLFVAATDGAIYVCDARTGLLVETLTGHELEVLDFAIGTSGTVILSAGEDKAVRIFNVKAE